MTKLKMTTLIHAERISSMMPASALPFGGRAGVSDLFGDNKDILQCYGKPPAGLAGVIGEKFPLFPRFRERNCSLNLCSMHYEQTNEARR